MSWTGSSLSIWSGKRTREWGLTFYSHTLLPRLFSHATRAWLLSISLKWRARSQAVTVFIVLRDGCIARHRHRNGSVNSKRTHPPKSICQVPTSPLALDIWGRVDKIAQTLVCSQTHQFQSLLRDLSPVIWRNRSVSTIGDKIVETLYLTRVTSENKRIRTSPLSFPFKVGVFVVFYR